MKNNLEIVQTIAKVLKIIMKIIMIITYVSAALTLIAGSLLVMGVLNAENQYLHFISVHAGLTEEMLAMTLIAAAISLLFTAIISTLLYVYFVKELKDGTPFTFSGADRLMKLGIAVAVLSVVSDAVTSAIIEHNSLSFMTNPADSVDITLGIGMILLSFVFRYGAELEQTAKR
ncbi:MAG: hypothetical protein J6I50_04135 [Clostridia bacterium]|nr:hypothetical protein [Clostridia bacterium]